MLKASLRVHILSHCYKQRQPALQLQPVCYHVCCQPGAAAGGMGCWIVTAIQLYFLLLSGEFCYGLRQDLHNLQ